MSNISRFVVDRYCCAHSLGARIFGTKKYKTMVGSVLSTTIKEKDLRVTNSVDMKISEQCGIASSKGNQIVGI